MRRIVLASLLTVLCWPAAAEASHTDGGCTNCASHRWWPSIDGVLLIAREDPYASVSYRGTARSDELLGHHGSDVLFGGRRSDVLWGDYDPMGQPARQRDRLMGGRGNDFIYGSHGRNRIFGGPGNDAISVHYGRGSVDCGPGRDIYHVARSRKHRYRFRDCERVEYRTESQRGGGLRPLR